MEESWEGLGVAAVLELMRGVSLLLESEEKALAKRGGELDGGRALK